MSVYLPSAAVCVTACVLSLFRGKGLLGRDQFEEGSEKEQSRQREKTLKKPNAVVCHQVNDVLFLRTEQCDFWMSRSKTYS